MDELLSSVYGWLKQKNPQPKYLQLIRQSMDEVIDSPRTGRKYITELEKTEKTYIGTRIEIILRNTLGVKKGVNLDLSINGIDVDVKFTVGDTWMIPQEAFDQICLLVRGNEKRNIYEIGLLRMLSENLTHIENRDRKLSVSFGGKKNILWLARGAIENIKSEPSIIPEDYII